MKFQSSMVGLGNSGQFALRRFLLPAAANEAAPRALAWLRAALLGLMLLSGPAFATDSAQVKKLLANPPREYTTGPLWVWNDLRLEALSKNQGVIWHFGDVPTRVDGAVSERVKQMAQSSALWRKIDSSADLSAPEWLGNLRRSSGVVIHRASGARGILFHHRRQLEDGQILFLVNTSIEFPSTGEIEADLNGVQQWNLYSGKTEPYPFLSGSQGIKFSYQLPPSGSLMLFLSKKRLLPAPSFFTATTSLETSGPLTIRRVGPNVLTLDYVDLTAGDETKSNLYFYQANQFAWQKNGVERNPWDSAVQFKDELIAKKFPPSSGFQATYRFVLEGAVPKNLAIVIERPDLYPITCNGQSVSARPGDWWLDQAFGKINLAEVARLGENTPR